MKRAIIISSVALAIFMSVLLIRTELLNQQRLNIDRVSYTGLDVHVVSDHLAQVIRFPTISSPDINFPQEAFRGLHAFIAQAFPKVHHTLSKEIIGDHNLLFTWQGHEARLKPVLFMAHMDVVPVETGTEASWSHPPFSGDIADGYIWGRGAMDDKFRVMAMLDAVELLIKEGFTPRRTLMFAFGYDEEIGGLNGASKIASLLDGRGLKFESIFDEGGAILNQGIFPRISKPIAMIGIAEKGYLNLELTVESEGGHSSMPPAHTAIGIMGSAIHRLEDQQFPSRLEGATHKLLQYLAPELPFSQRLMFANLWLFGFLVEGQLSRTPATNAVIRTTVAITRMQGGVKENLLPIRARVVLNVRILPGETVESAFHRIARIVDDPRVTIKPLGQTSEPSFESSTESWGFRILTRSIREIFGEVLVAPCLIPGLTDSRHYSRLSLDVYRFSPLEIGSDDLPRIHGTNERISVENYVRAVQFYRQVIRNTEE
jgi:carboxypeptidase PM20D1